ncbi:hypothetical protein GLOTRDRAFT_65863 [Gloeophyllum trabeum ATCC 11539]|uniref:Uncharacterized protein n=1 Tax=Gloeophyllum trabeum (strain ATCC 11539 / FP-39264 / Madison 617) TaxID=670483 RepID=S7PVV7_GLOTA|nr:uncharacterized protein GLOTRDRAFT_65863 [Gloeophyllum trabeum ATCC 11539]EPQ51653.1 hypothetical protein GLOTRDRAFT_65863 [Gloeophyllum trabeum ATCC 11539]
MATNLLSLLLSLCLSASCTANAARGAPPTPLSRRDSTGYVNPVTNGGSMLTNAPNTYPAGLGEPLNAIISGNSDSDVLSLTGDSGLNNYFLSIGFGTECLGIHEGDAQTANLGDGKGTVNETAEIRWDYYNPGLGTCTETQQGGNHFRYWVQNGTNVNTGAIFMAVSYELPLAQNHDIVPNGYNLGRDWLVGNATSRNITTSDYSTSGGTQFSGSTSYNGWTYQTTATYTTGLLNATSDGINHYATVAVNGQPAIDGLVAVLEVKVTQKGSGSSSSSNKTSAAPSLVYSPIQYLTLALVAPIIAFFALYAAL